MNTNTFIRRAVVNWSSFVIFCAVTFLLFVFPVCSLIPKADAASPQTVSSKDQSVIQTKVTHCFAPESLFGKLPVFLKEHVEKATNGRMKVTVYPSATMFATAAEEVQGCMSGMIQFGYFNINHLAGYDGRWNILTAPGVINGWTHMQKFMNSPVYKQLNEDLAAKTGAKILYWACDIPYGDVPWNKKRPIVTPQDWKGLKMRAAPSEIQIESLKALGASPIVLQTAEVLAALSQGVVDGGLITPATAITAWSAKETCPYLTLPYGGWAFTNMFVGFLVNVKWWESLPKDIRDAIIAEAPAAARHSNDTVHEVSTKLLKDYESIPKNKVTRLTKEQTGVWQEILGKSVLPKIEEKFKGKAIVEQAKQYTP